MRFGKIFILTALEREARAIAESFGVGLEAGRATVLPRTRIPTELHIIGIRAIRMPLLSEEMISRIIVAGVAGALDPALRPGDIVTDDSGQNIHTSNQLISTPAAKASLFHQTRAVAVDMESSIVRHLAKARNIPVLTIRGISDTADEGLSPRLMNWIDDTGRPKAGALAIGLITHPWLIPGLMRLGKRTTLAMANVSKAIHEQVD